MANCFQTITGISTPCLTTNIINNLKDTKKTAILLKRLRSAIANLDTTNIQSKTDFASDLPYFLKLQTPFITAKCGTTI